MSINQNNIRQYFVVRTLLRLLYINGANKKLPGNRSTAEFVGSSRLSVIKPRCSSQLEANRASFLSPDEPAGRVSAYIDYTIRYDCHYLFPDLAFLSLCNSCSCIPFLFSTAASAPCASCSVVKAKNHKVKCFSKREGIKKRSI